MDVSMDLSAEDSNGRALRESRSFQPSLQVIVGGSWVQGLQFVMDLQGPDPRYAPWVTRVRHSGL
jgi:hypothetical protein